MQSTFCKYQTNISNTRGRFDKLVTNYKIFESPKICVCFAQIMKIQLKTKPSPISLKTVQNLIFNEKQFFINLFFRQFIYVQKETTAIMRQEERLENAQLPVDVLKWFRTINSTALGQQFVRISLPIWSYAVRRQWNRLQIYRFSATIMNQTIEDQQLWVNVKAKQVSNIYLLLLSK